MDNRINKTEILHDDDLGLEQIKNQHVLFTWANYMLSTGVIMLINLDFGFNFYCLHKHATYSITLK